MNREDRLEALEPIRFASGEVRLWHLELEPRAGDEAMALLSDEDRERVVSLPAEHRHRLLARRALLAVAVGQHLGCARSQLVWWRAGATTRVVGPAGRSVHASLSVSGARGLLALADRPVGVDVELQSAVPEALEIARLLLAPGERAWIEAGAVPGSDDVAQRFLRTWVRKEAVVKCTGTGLAAGDLHEFTVDASRAVAPVMGGQPGEAGLQTIEVSLDGAFAAACVAAV